MDQHEDLRTAGQRDHSGASSFLVRPDEQLPARSEAANQNAPATGAWQRWAVAARLGGSGGGKGW